MKRISIILLLLCSYANAADYEAWIGAEHITNDQDAIQLGLTVEWSHFELDITHGIKRMKWRTIGEPEWNMDEWQSGSSAGLRWYPLSSEKVRPFITWSHSSDITRGGPFNDTEEPTSDFVGVGIAVEYRSIDIQVAIGRTAREMSVTCAITKCVGVSATSEALIRIRGNFWGTK